MVERGWVANGPDFKRDLKSRQMTAILLKIHLKCVQKHPDFEWSGLEWLGL